MDKRQDLFALAKEAVGSRICQEQDFYKVLAALSSLEGNIGRIQIRRFKQPVCWVIGNGQSVRVEEL